MPHWVQCFEIFSFVTTDSYTASFVSNCAQLVSLHNIFADFSFTGMENTYDVCTHIAVEAYWCPLDVTGR